MIALRPDPATTDRIEHFADLFAQVAADERAVSSWAGGPQRSDESPQRTADTTGWRRLAAAGALRPTPESVGTTGADGIGPVTAGTLAAEQAGRHLVRLAYPDALFAADITAALRTGLTAPDRPVELAEAVTAGTMVAVVAADRRLGLRPGSDSGQADVELGLRGAVLNGRLRFVRGAGGADRLLVITPAPAGPVVAVIPVDRHGVTVRRQDDLDRAGELAQVDLDQVQVRADELFSWPPAAPTWPELVDRARIRLAGYLVGLTAAAVDTAIGHARGRTQFGRPVATFQAVSFPLAAALARIRAARLLCWHAAWAADHGHPIDQLAAQALALTADLAVPVTAQAVQTHGAIGLTEAHVAQRFYRRAVIAAHWLGTGERLAEQAAPGLVRTGSSGAGAHRIGREGGRGAQ
jgi:alkylation response protein AidB-like acyl-CoA dehydrogenase